jgi:inositol hexakisphosphate/diphosphoinositol-pentakisphosphate kinase
MKLKFNIKGAWPWSKPFIQLLQGRQDEIILREEEQLRFIETAANEALLLEGADIEMLNSMKKILDKKIGVSGTKAQYNRQVGWRIHSRWKISEQRPW